jgi:hypothetical protein
MNQFKGINSYGTLLLKWSYQAGLYGDHGQGKEKRRKFMKKLPGKTKGVIN